MTSESLVTRWKWMNRLIESRAFSLLRPGNHRADGRKRSGVSRWVQKHKYTSKPILSKHFEPKISEIELWFCGQSPMYSYQQQGIWQLSSSFWMNARWLCSITIVGRFFVAPNCYHSVSNCITLCGTKLYHSVPRWRRSGVSQRRDRCEIVHIGLLYDSSSWSKYPKFFDLPKGAKL